MLFRNRLTGGTVLLLTLITLLATDLRVYAEVSSGNDVALTTQTAGLEECLKTALQNNRRRPASRYAVEMAEAQHRQAMAAYWPQIAATGGYQVMDEAPNFIFPASSISLPMGGSIPITIPGVGVIPTSSITVPAQDVKLMDRESAILIMG